MNEQPDVSIVISTYNRCEMLPDALESVLAQDKGGANFEVLVVDNNSTDRTRQVVESLMAKGHSNLRYVFEGAQGLSHARNAGIAQARAPIVAFTDDDVRVASDWATVIKRAFDEHPEVDCVGGKVLPRWETEPPRWLTRDHWSPLALTDYGDESFYVNTEKPICLIGANLSFRREVFEKVGLFNPDLQRVKDGIGSMEDHEFLLRFWQTGRQGMYVPELVVNAEVQTERTGKEYHRRWHRGHGHFNALMRLEEVETTRARLFDVPAHLYRQALMDALGWLKHSALLHSDEALVFEMKLRFFAGFFSKRRQDYLARENRGNVREILTFVRSLTRGQSTKAHAH